MLAYHLFQENPSEENINQCILVVVNLNYSISNDELRQIFGVYGEIKEVSIGANIIDYVHTSIKLLTVVFWM